MNTLSLFLSLFLFPFSFHSFFAIRLLNRLLEKPILFPCLSDPFPALSTPDPRATSPTGKFGPTRLWPIRLSSQIMTRGSSPLQSDRAAKVCLLHAAWMIDGSECMTDVLLMSVIQHHVSTCLGRVIALVNHDLLIYSDFGMVVVAVS